MRAISRSARSQARAVFHAELVHLVGVLAAELLEEVAPHQLIVDGPENAFLDFMTGDRQSIRATALRPR